MNELKCKERKTVHRQGTKKRYQLSVIINKVAQLTPESGALHDLSLPISPNQEKNVMMTTIMPMVEVMGPDRNITLVQ